MLHKYITTFLVLNEIHLWCTDDVEQRRWFHRSAATSKKQTNLTEKTCTQRSSFQMVVSETGAIARPARLAMPPLMT